MNKNEKRFPATVTLEALNFLNDKKINGELYAYLQGISEFLVIDKASNDYVCYIMKNKMPKQTVMCEILGIKSPKTLRTNLAYLIKKGYVIEESDRYVLPEAENVYLLIPLKTLQYLNDNCKDHVIKIYVYLGQRYKWGLQDGFTYEFTLKDIGTHLGLKIENNSRGYEIINNALDLLVNSGLISYSVYFDGVKQKRKLTGFSFEYIQNS